MEVRQLDLIIVQGIAVNGCHSLRLYNTAWAGYKWRPFSMSEHRRSCSWWAYEGEVEQWAEEEVERELAEMTGSLLQLAALEEEEEEEEGESGSSVHGSESESDCSELFARILAARAAFLEGARSFLDFSTQEVHSGEEGISCNAMYVCWSCTCLERLTAAGGGLLARGREGPSTPLGAVPRQGGEVCAYTGGPWCRGADECVLLLTSLSCPAHKTTELHGELDTPTDRDPSPTQTPPASVTPPDASLTATPTGVPPTATPTVTSTADLLTPAPIATPTAAPPTATPPVSPSTEVPSPVLCWEEEGLDTTAVQQQEVSGARCQGQPLWQSCDGHVTMQNFLRACDEECRHLRQQEEMKRLELEQRVVAKRSWAAVLLQSWWKGWRCVGKGGVWWEGWRCVERGGVCGEG